MKRFLTPISVVRSTGGIVLVITLAVLLRVLLIAASLEHVPATSDEASIVLQAKEIARGNFPLLFLGQPLLFPVEAYTMAPLVEWLPRTTLGARYQTWVLGSLSVVGFLFLARSVFAKNQRWPAYLLILFPSSYLLLLTAGYAPPQYPTSLTLAWISFLLVLRHRQHPRIFLPVAAGAACGLAISNHLLFFPVALGVYAMIVFNGKFKEGVSGSLPFALGLAMGLAPFLAAIIMIPGAYPGFGPTQPLPETITELCHFVISESLAGAMGMYPTLFPDLPAARQIWSKEIRLLFSLGYLVLCLYLLWLRGSVMLRDLRERRWPKVELVDATMVISFLTILIFASHDNEYFYFRYLLHAVWCIPFLVGFAHAASSGRGKRCLAVIIVCCALFNIVCSAKMIRQWRKPGRISTQADLPSLAPLLPTLSTMEVAHCYASFWLAYRISWESDEKIKCTGPYNERFVGWPIPYKEAVDEDERTVYVLTVSPLAKLNALEFANNMAAQGMGYEKIEVGERSAPFHIYHHFSQNHQGPERPAAIDQTIDCRESADPCHDNFLGDQQPLWHIALTAPQTLTHLRLQQDPLLANLEENLQLAVRDHGRWRLLADGSDYSFLRLSFAHGHPIYHDNYHLIRFQETSADALVIGLSQLPPHSSGRSPAFSLYAKP